MQRFLADRWMLTLATVFLAAMVVSLFVWILGIEPFVRHRRRKSAFLLLPWAQWQNYFAGLRMIARKSRAVPWFFRFYQALQLIELGCLLLLTLRLTLKSL